MICSVGLNLDEVPSPNKGAALHVGRGSLGLGDPTSIAPNNLTQVPQVCPLSYYWDMMEGPFLNRDSTVLPPPNFIFGHCELDTIRHGESLPHASTSRRGQSSRYPRSQVAWAFCFGDPLLHREDSVH